MSTRIAARGKEPLARALEKAYPEKYEKAIDKYLEATQVDCNGEATVTEADETPVAFGAEAGS